MAKYKWTEVGCFPEGAPEGLVDAGSPYEVARALAEKALGKPGEELSFGPLYSHPGRVGCEVWYVEEPWGTGTAMRQFEIEEMQA